MVITHNLYAENAQRQYKITGQNKKKSIEKLSSGYKINRSADDAAGLAISETMRRQIRGLDQGKDNIQDGISLCQTADGALAEVTSVLQRVRELSIQAYNGTNSKTDRECIQDEVEECLFSIDEIKERTKFNEIYILRGQQNAGNEIRYARIEETHQETAITTEGRTIPDWLIINDGADKSIQEHSGYNFTTDPNGTMFSDYSYIDVDGTQKSVPLYFGAYEGDEISGGYNKNYVYIEKYVKDNQGKDEYIKLLDQNPQLATYIQNHFDASGNYSGWTSTSTDNVSCKLDFGGLVTNTTNAETLYQNMFNLLGCEIGFPCGTCQGAVNAIQFSGEIDRWMEGT